MAKCKFCGQGVRVAPVFHPACWEQTVNKLASEFCDVPEADFLMHHLRGEEDTHDD